MVAVGQTAVGGETVMARIDMAAAPVVADKVIIEPDSPEPEATF
jgi:hypothetical protein